MMPSIQALLLTVACFIATTSLSYSLPSIRFSPYVRFQGLEDVPNPWVYQQPAPSNHTLKIRIGLKLQNVEDFHQRVIDMSTPGHPSYGAHMNRDEVNAMLNPSGETALLVLEWLKSFGILGVHDNQWVKAEVTVAQAQELLQTEYSVYTNSINDRTIIRTTSYSIPSILFDHLDLIQPTTTFGMEPQVSSIQPQTAFRIKKRAVNSCDSAITPACIASLYNTANYVPTQSSRNSIGAVGFDDKYANMADLQTFFKEFRAGTENPSYTTVLVHGGKDDQSIPGIAANLDVQYTAGIAFPTPIKFYSVAGTAPSNPSSVSTTNEPFLDFLDFILEQADIPQTLIITYADEEQTVPRDYATQVCNLFAQLGSRGTTVLVSSGDAGVGEGSCETNDGAKRRVFQPTFPASCPFVTSVGGTTHSPEVAAGYSGGGFSNYFSQPSYQTAAVSKYLSSLGNTFAGLYNPSGRGYPDVAAQSGNFQIIVGQKQVTVSSTSGSAAVFGAVIGLLNDYRLAQQKPPLGFLNPLIYSAAASGFNDVESGSNPGCGTAGFTASPGWDPLTGLGTPDFIKLKTLL